jgi:hypothetical protein
MKGKLPVIFFSALLIMANSANAQHRTRGHGYPRWETPQFSHRVASTDPFRKVISRIQIRTGSSM